MLKRKLLAIVTSLSMIATLATSFVAQAATPAVMPKITFSLDIENLGEFNEDVDGELFEWEFEDGTYYGQTLHALTLSVDGFAARAAVKEGGTTVAYTGAQTNQYTVQSTFNNEKFAYLKAISKITSGSLVAGVTEDGGSLSFTWANTDETLKASGPVAVMYLISEDTAAETEKFSLHSAATKVKTYYDGTTKDKYTDVPVSVEDGTLVLVGLNENVAPEEPVGPTVVEGVADTADLETSTIDGSKYTGVTATFVGDKYTAITFNFNNGSADGSYVWELGEDIVSIDSNMVFGLNIQNIPAEITTFTCTGVTATVAE